MTTAIGAALNLLYANVIEANAPWGAEVFMNDALIKAGYQTQTVDYRVHRRHLSRCFGAADDFDVFLLQRGDHFPLNLVRAIQRPRVFYFSELFAARRDADHLFASNLFDHYFVRGFDCRDELVRRGWIPEHKISLLLSAFDPKTYYPTTATKDIDILFLGSMTPRRAKLLEQLAARFHIEVKSAFGTAASELYNRAKIVLNLHANDYLDTETRIYEVLGARGFLLTEKLAHESPFSSGIHLVEAEDYTHLVELLTYYLSHEDERLAVAAQGYEAALAEHTYQARVQQMMRTIESVLPPSKRSAPPIDPGQLRTYRMEEQVLGYAYKFKGLLKRILRNLKPT